MKNICLEDIPISVLFSVLWDIDPITFYCVACHFQLHNDNVEVVLLSVLEPLIDLSVGILFF